MQTRISKGKEIGNLINQTHTKLMQISQSQGLHINTAQQLFKNCLSLTNQKIDFREKLTYALDNILPIENRLPHKTKFVAMLGATGVGKTTTIAKLAARIKMAFDLRIALISADYYRIGAGYQLQTYANLMKLPYRALDKRKDLNQELDKSLEYFSAYDLVLIDAAGFSPYRDSRLSELRDLFSSRPEIERMLVLPAPGNEYDLIQSIERFSSVGFERLVISKLDESGFIGPVLNALRTAGKPLAFFTTGQRVPEDIEPASHRRLAQILTRTMH